MMRLTRSLRGFPASRCRWIGGLLLSAATLATPVAAATSVSVSAKLLRNDISYTVYGSNSFAPFDQGGSLIDVSRGNSTAHGLTFEALSELNEGSILFKNSIIGSGAGTRLRATIGVEITIDNEFGFDFTPVLRTKLLAAGMGMFFAAPVYNVFADDSGRPSAPSTLDCTAAQLKNCAPITDPGIAALFDKPGDIFGRTSTGFDFNVTVGGESKYRMQASIGYDANGNFVADLDDAKKLADFRRSDTADQLYTTAYAWDDTFVDIKLGDELKAGEKLTAVYTISTFIDIGKASGDYMRFFPTEDGGKTLVITPGAFAAFGDPIGGGGTIDDTGDTAAFASALFNFASLSETPAAPARINTNGTGVFSLPYFIEDPVTGTPTTIFDAETEVPPADILPYGPPLRTEAIPEPSVWAFMIIGFGAIGAALRRRPVPRKSVHVA